MTVRIMTIYQPLVFMSVAMVILNLHDFPVDSLVTMRVGNILPKEAIMMIATITATSNLKVEQAHDQYTCCY